MAAKDGIKMPNMTLPTGYESEQRKIELKRKLAQAMLEKGLTPQQGMRSPFEALGVLANAYAGKRMEKKATQREADLNEQIKADYAEKLRGYQALRDSGASNTAILDAFGGDPLMESVVEPHAKAYAHGLSQNEDQITFGGRRTRSGDVMGQIEPSKPTDAVIRGRDGSWNVNPVALTADMQARTVQPGQSIAGAVTSIPDPYQGPSGQSPAVSSQAQPDAAPVTGGTDFSTLGAEDKALLSYILRGQQGPTPGAAPGGGKPPDGQTTEGKPYWLINGVPYDNPEGR